MSRRRETVLTVAAIVVLATVIPVTFALSDIRERQATAQQRDDLINSTVASRQAPADFDGDGIADGSDDCPTRPETTNDFQDGDGCPDVVATTGAS